MTSSLIDVVMTCISVVIFSNTNILFISILGNEGMGVREEILNICTQLTTVPSFSNSHLENLDSLNVSVASGRFK